MNIVTLMHISLIKVKGETKVLRGDHEQICFLVILVETVFQEALVVLQKLLVLATYRNNVIKLQEILVMTMMVCDG